MPHPTELRLTLSEQRRSLLSCAAPCWQCGTLLSYAASLLRAKPYPAELRRILTDLRRTLLSYTIPYSVRYRSLVFLLLCEGDGLSYLCPSLHPPPPAKGRGICSIFAGGAGRGDCGVFLFTWWTNLCWNTEALNYTLECKFKYNGLPFWINLLSIEKGKLFNHHIKTICAEPFACSKVVQNCLNFYIVQYLSFENFYVTNISFTFFDSRVLTTFFNMMCLKFANHPVRMYAKYSFLKNLHVRKKTWRFF